MACRGSGWREEGKSFVLCLGRIYLALSVHGLNRGGYEMGLATVEPLVPCANDRTDAVDPRYLFIYLKDKSNQLEVSCNSMVKISLRMI